jgi:Rrf2 family protein
MPKDEMAIAKQVAREEGIPSYFLQQILRRLARYGFLKCIRGRSGGFCLKIPADKITLVALIEAMEGRVPECSEEEQAWAIHEPLKELSASIIEYLQRTTIADLAAGPEKRSAGKHRTKKA